MTPVFQPADAVPEGPVFWQLPDRMTYEVFRSEQAAARMILREWHPIAQALNKEIGAQLCRYGGVYFSARANISAYSDQVQPTRCPFGTRAVGSWHVHVEFGQDVPSGPDFANARRNPGLRYYLATPAGQFLRYEAARAKPIELKPDGE